MDEDEAYAAALWMAGRREREREGRIERRESSEESDVEVIEERTARTRSQVASQTSPRRTRNSARTGGSAASESASTASGASGASASTLPPKMEPPDMGPSIEILVKSRHPAHRDSHIFKRRYRQKLDALFKAWRQVAEIPANEELVFSFKEAKVFPFGTLKGLGVREGTEKVAFQVWSAESWERRREEGEEVGEDTFMDDSQVQEDAEVEEEEEDSVTFLLRAKDAQQVNISIAKSKTVGELIERYKEEVGVGRRKVTLKFEGEEWEPGMRIGELELEEEEEDEEVLVDVVVG